MKTLGSSAVFLLQNQRGQAMSRPYDGYDYNRPIMAVRVTAIICIAAMYLLELIAS